MKYIKPEITVMSGQVVLLAASGPDKGGCSCGCSSADPTHYGCYGCPNCNHSNDSEHICKSKESIDWEDESWK